MIISPRPSAGQAQQQPAPKVGPGGQPGWCWLDRRIITDYGQRLGPQGIAVYMVLVAHADTDRVCYPSYDRLAELAGVCRRTAIAAVQKLVDLGLVEVISRGGPQGRQANRYRLLPLPPAPPPTDEPATGAPGAPLVVHQVHHNGEVVHLVHPTGAPHAPQVVHLVHLTGAPHAPEREPANDSHTNESHPTIASGQEIKTISKRPGEETHPPTLAMEAQAEPPPAPPKRRSNLPCDNPEVAPQARKLARELEQALGTEHLSNAVPEVIGRLNEGHTPDDLRWAAQAAARHWKRTGLAPGYRPSARSFFGEGGAFERFLEAASEPEPLDPEEERTRRLREQTERNKQKLAEAEKAIAGKPRRLLSDRMPELARQREIQLAIREGRPIPPRPAAAGHDAAAEEKQEVKSGQV